jgi:hypothetical protein
MRRPIVPLSLFVAVAGIWILGIAGPATAVGRAPHIICPVPAPHFVTCCPLPVADAQPICCPTTCCAAGNAPQPLCCVSGSTAQPVCCPTAGCCTPPCSAGSLTIAASPNPSTAGRKVVVSGAFVGSTVSGATVVLWRELAGQSSFTQVSQTTTDGTGHYTFALARGMVMADQAWYVMANGVKSATVQQLVTAQVGLSSTHAVTVGHPLVLRGHVTPSHAGQTVLIEQSRGGAWHVIARARLGNGSSYVASHHFSRAGAIELRTVLPGDTRNGRSVSPSLTVTVKR